MKSAAADFMVGKPLCDMKENSKNTTNQMARMLVFVAFLGIGAVFFSGPIHDLLMVSKNRELYSHIPLIPFVSLYFFFVGRKTIFAEVRWDYLRGLPMIGAALFLYWAGGSLQGQVNQNDYFSFMMSGVFLWVIGSFFFSFGLSSLRKAAFPLLFLAFIIPIPTLLLDPFVRFLQLGSAEFAHGIFKLTGVPLHRDGMFFSLPGLTIEVAEQCSGIRSSIALFITVIMAGKLFLKSGWSRFVLALSIFPISMFKNAMRIVTLSLLGSYVDPRFITGSWLHSSGGIPFFGVALMLLLPVLWALRKRERRKVRAQSS
jgi:exosortase